MVSAHLAIAFASVSVRTPVRSGEARVTLRTLRGRRQLSMNLIKASKCT
jgi:hypothetical protein